MVNSYGETRAKEILRNRHNTIYFPNIMVKGPQTLRVFKPIAANRTLVESWIFRLVGAPDMLLERTAMYNRLINAPTSIVGHATEVYERAQEGLECNGNSWMNFQRDHFSPEENLPKRSLTAQRLKCEINLEHGKNLWELQNQGLTGDAN